MSRLLLHEIVIVGDSISAASFFLLLCNNCYRHKTESALNYYYNAFHETYIMGVSL